MNHHLLHNSYRRRTAGEQKHQYSFPGGLDRPRSKHLEVVENPHEVCSQPLRRFVGNLDAILKHGDREARARA